MAMLRLLLLGGTGRLGSAVLREAGTWASLAVRAPTRDEADLARLTADGARALVDPELIDVVLNCAAAAHVDRCETQRDEAHAVNAVAPGLLAEACARVGLPFLHISTDYVFGGGAGPYAEDAAPCPVQHYGVTKAEGERRVLAAGGRGTIARVSWLFGPGATPFADWVLGQVDRAEAAVFAEQQSRPTWIPGLASWLLDVCSVLEHGSFAPRILHPAGGPHASRAEWARAILDARGHHDVRVVSQSSPPPAPRPSDSRLDSTRTDDWVLATFADPFGTSPLPRIPDWRDHV